jgi:hypothetical protein
MAFLGSTRLRRPTAITGPAVHTPAGGPAPKLFRNAALRSKAAQTSLTMHTALHGKNSSLKPAKKLR